MSRKILFFINPVSGVKSKLKLEEKIVQICSESGIAFEILFTSKDGDYGFLPGKISAESITDIAICGGDGSIAPIVSALLHVDVNIGIIPLGSGNGLARTAGIPKSTLEAIKTVIEGNAVSVDAFFINKKLSTHVCGLGYDAKVAHDFAKQKKRGLQQYTRLAIKNFTSARTYPFTIETKNEQFKTEAFLICIANSNQFGNNLKIAPMASICDGLLDIVILQKTTKANIVFSFLRHILSGEAKPLSSKKILKNNILYFQTKKITIGNPEGAPLHIDGDPSQTYSELTFEILPKAYRLIFPVSK